VISVALVLGISGTATGTPGDPSSASTSYRIVEGELGGNGQFNSASTNFTFNPSVDDGGSSLGETAVGNGKSTSFQTNSGFDTTAQPGLTFIVNTSTVALGILSTGTKTTGTATFSVLDYTSYGYVVQIVGTTPGYGGHNLTALTTDTASSAGTEQFGINTVRNTVAALGADPVQVPSSAFSFGVAGDGATGTYGTTRPYTISDQWRYVSGDTVASGPKSSGETDFTMTFLANISGLTPSGGYVGSLSLVATGTY
jgi:hypothetical protein